MISKKNFLLKIIFTIYSILKNMFRRKINWSIFFFFIAVAIASAIFRMTNLTVIEFKADEAINLFLASRPLFGHPFPPGGTVSSIGILNPPLLNYLLFPFVLISFDPKAISLFIGLLNSLAIGFFFLLLKRYYDTITAFIASLLLAFSPWSILFSRKIWTQNLMFPFLVLLLYSLHKVVLEKKMIYWIIYVIASLFLFQLHQSSLFFLLLISGFLLLKKVKFNLAYILVGFFLGIMPAIPYFVYVLKNAFSNPQVFLIAKERFSSGYFPIIFFRPLQITGQGNFHFVLGDDMLTFANQFPLFYQLRRFFYIEYLLLPFGALIFWKKFPKLRLLVYATIGLPVIYFFLHFQPFMHYFIILAPLLFLFLASGLSFFLDFPKPIIKNISLLVFLALLGVSITFNLIFFRLLNQQKAFKGDYGISFTIIEQNVKRRLKNYENDKNYQEMVLASYLPKNLLYGNLPVAKMLYSYEKTQKSLSALEERLKQIPEDARVQNELLAFWTTLPPTIETLHLLEEKSQNSPGYKLIYDEVHKLFLAQSP